MLLAAKSKGILEAAAESLGPGSGQWPWVTLSFAESELGLKPGFSRSDQAWYYTKVLHFGFS